MVVLAYILMRRWKGCSQTTWHIQSETSSKASHNRTEMKTNLTLATWGRATVQGLLGVRGVRREMQAPLQPGFLKCRDAPVLYINMKAGFFNTGASSLL